jgi:hypothetical protein
LRNFTLPLVASFLLSLLALNVSAQKTLPPQETGGSAARERCGTMEALERWFNQNPAAREQYLRNVEEGQRQAAAYRESGASQSYRQQAIVTIPVVVHLVLPANRQAQVTNADVIWQINKLNEDFAGDNADSTNATNFYNIRGRSQIRFCLASQDPAGNPTNGINRVYSTITDFSSATVGAIKNSSSCGADSWDPNRYFNIWVAQSTSLLGIATFPNTGVAGEQGIALALDGFSNNPVYVNPAFNKGRTAVHEAGHYFGLYHSWGDDGTACTGDDFRQLPASICVLPAGLLAGDTPNQAGPTSGCPTGVRTDLCSAVSPGFNYQNYMDYTDDACYSMFTKKQVERAEYVLNTCRTSLLGSNGCAPVTLFNNDASPKLMSPGNSCFPGGIGSTFCQNTTFNAQVMLFNLGSNTLNSVRLNAQVGSGPITTFDYTTPLTSLNQVLVTIPNISTGTASGTVELKIFTSNPNGGADGRGSNDTARINITVTAGGGGATSVTEGFESATFPPTGWTLQNPNAGSLTWVRTTAARNSGTASAYINYYNYTTTGHMDYLVSPIVNIQDADSIVVTFARAYKRYGTGTTFSDTLLIQAATQCGATTFPITAWKKGGTDLSTSPGTNTGNWFPLATDWATERIDLKPFIAAGQTSLIVAFAGKNGFGQNLFLDDINIRTVIALNRDAELRAIISPFSKVCTGAITPAVTIFNNGKLNLTTLKIGYRIIGPSFNLLDSVTFNGNLPQGQATNVNLKPVTLPAAGNYTIQAWTKEPNGSTDQNTANDTSVVVSFRFVPTVPLPITESFESTTFPPPNWARVNQDNQGTWFRTTAAAKAGTASAAIDNYNYNANGTIDDLESPQLSYSGIDSAFLSFQLAHASYLYPGSTGLPLDSLQVLVTKDCGQTFTVVYNKWGEDLQTVSNPNAPFTDLFIPTASQWRQERVNLTAALGTSGSVQVIFRSKGNFGNTVLLDDVQITTKTLPARLKQNGYMIAPNPFNGSFAIQHYLTPMNLRGIQITNSAGQLIWSKNYNGNAQSYITIDLSRYASGMYTVKMIYDNKVITERVIKRS